MPHAFLPTSRSLQRAAAALLGAWVMVFAVHAEAAARTLDTAYGAVSLDGTPQRVMVLTETALDTALALGVKPVGTLATRGGSGVANYLKDKAGPIAMAGTSREVNLEAVLQLQPDLILAAPDLTRDLYAKLSLMAPTLVPKGNAFDAWRDVTTFYAEALGKRAEAEAYLEQIDARIAALKKQIKPGVVASVVRWNPQGPILMSNRLFVGQLLGQLGFESTALARSLTEKPHSDTLSLENLSQVDGDWLFLATLNPDGEKALQQARRQPAFERLNAVSHGKLLSVDGQVWSSGSGPLAAQIVLDDVEKALRD